MGSLEHVGGTAGGQFLRRICLMFFVGFSGPLLAQEGPSFDCAKAASSVETLICEDGELAQLDQSVAARYATALAAAQGLDAGADAAVAELRAFQRGWIKGRDECWKAGDMRACVADTMRRRDAELVALWMLEAPRATVFWACDGSPANEVVTQFFDTDLASVRIERGDTVDAGVQVRSASGARYVASFGREIWVKGDEATYQDPGSDPVTCRRQAG